LNYTRVLSKHKQTVFKYPANYFQLRRQSIIDL